MWNFSFNSISSSLFSVRKMHEKEKTNSNWQNNNNRNVHEDPMDSNSITFDWLLNQIIIIECCRTHKMCEWWSKIRKSLNFGFGFGAGNPYGCRVDDQMHSHSFRAFICLEFGGRTHMCMGDVIFQVFAVVVLSVDQHQFLFRKRKLCGHVNDLQNDIL